MRTVISSGPAAIRRTPTLKYWASAPTSMYATFDPRSAMPVQSSCQVILNLRPASACSTVTRADPGSPVTTKSTYVLATIVPPIHSHGPAPAPQVAVAAGLLYRELTGSVKVRRPGADAPGRRTSVRTRIRWELLALL